jgi:hypothetical protein
MSDDTETHDREPYKEGYYCVFPSEPLINGKDPRKFTRGEDVCLKNTLWERGRYIQVHNPHKNYFKHIIETEGKPRHLSYTQVGKLVPKPALKKEKVSIVAEKVLPERNFPNNLSKLVAEFGAQHPKKYSEPKKPKPSGGRLRKTRKATKSSKAKKSRKHK